MMTEAERSDVRQALGSLNLNHRDVVVAIVLALTLNNVPFQKQKQMLVIVHEILDEMGLVKVMLSNELSEYVGVARRAGLIQSAPSTENRTYSIVTLTAVGRRVPTYYAEMISSSAVDPTDIPALQWHLHLKRSLVGDCFSIHVLAAELRKTKHFADRLYGSSLLMQKTYLQNVLASPVFSRQLEVDGDTVRVLGSTKLF